MELLSPSPPPHPAIDRLNRTPSPAALLRVFERESLAPPGARDVLADGIVHVAVGRSLDKTLGLLQWTFQRFGCKEIGLVHVHKPSPMIPTLLGKLPANQANEEFVSAYRSEERKETEKILLSYQSICYTAQVQPKIIMTETGYTQKGIVDLITRHGIRKLVMGAIPDNCFKVKGSSSKVSYIAKNAPPFCEIWFVSKGKHLWTREASEGIDSFLPVFNPDETVLRERIRSSSLQNYNSEPMVVPETFRFSSFTTTEMRGGRNRELSESDNAEEVFSTTDSSITNFTNQTNSPRPTCFNSTGSWLTSASERRFSSEISPKAHEELELESLCNRLQEIMMKIERSKKEAFAELAKRKELESEIVEAFNRVKAFEDAYARETKIREELEDLLRTVKMQQEELVCEMNEATRELQNATTTIAFLDDHAQEVACRREEAANELELIQSSIATLRVERLKNQHQGERPLHRLERWRCSSCARSPNSNELFVCGDDSFNFTEFSSTDLQTATCDFSESFKLGQGGYGCVYKGEMLNRTVVIKKVNLHNVQGQKEFQQEVYVLSKLRHPHLVTLIGVCTEALSLVYEYLPNGTLHDRLFCRTTTPPLTWKIRTRIAVEISSALLFLHSSKPEKIIHGDLKPENIFLDSDFNCKIGDFGICHLVPEDTRPYPLFHWNKEPMGSFPYTDPEYQRTRVLTPKSDVYSFGIIILQLLTGKPPLGLVNEVRRAVLADKLSLILDTTAGEWPSDVATKLAEFGLQCSEMNSRDRPELTPEVVKELVQLHLMEERPVPPFFLCPILQEIMHDPQVAADGFTYEGSALRGWLANGRGTSPMTNLKLGHLNLTPNHALRSAIQDWLCQPCRS